MISEHENVALVKSPWTEELRTLISLVEDSLLVACPFVKHFATNLILSALSQPVRPSIHMGLITDLRPDSCLASGMDLAALSELGKGFRRFELIHLPSTHAKVYVADC